MPLWKRRNVSDEPMMTAAQWMHRGAELLDSNLDEAERCYQRAVEIDESLSGAWFDLGLIAKWRHDWPKCLELNRRAASLFDAGELSGNPACWNAGIAATALSDWEAARWAWRSFGIPIADGEGPIAEGFGPGVVRLPDGETVWGRRIDPARMQLLSIPLPESGFRSDDIVLHDGEPVGSRVAHDHEYSVFNVIERWQESEAPTVSVRISADATGVDHLTQMAEAAGIRGENWTESVVIHCKACSLGRVDFDHPDHDHSTHRAPDAPIRFGFSGTDGDIRALLDRWVTEANGHVLDVTVHDEP